MWLVLARVVFVLNLFYVALLAYLFWLLYRLAVKIPPTFKLRSSLRLVYFDVIVFNSNNRLSNMNCRKCLFLW